MKNKIVYNLFEFWKHIGSRTQTLHSTDQYHVVRPKNNSWPKKIFEISAKSNFEKLHKNIKNETLPNSIAILENEALEKELVLHDFTPGFLIKGMYLHLKEYDFPDSDFSSIDRVDNEEKAIVFAQIASASFGYEVLESTIKDLINSPKIKLFIGKHENHYANCGMLFLDENNYSGLHMIGTPPEFRGKSLGKLMTAKLLFEAAENKSETVVLVASESGERIYTKLGFKSDGYVKGYTV